MADGRVREMFDELVAKTNSRSLKWDAAATEGEFVAAMGGKYVIKLLPYTWVDPETGEPHGNPSLTIEDDKGISLMDINSGPSGVTGQELNGFAGSVRRIVYRLDEKIDDLLTQLKKLPGESHTK